VYGFIGFKVPRIDSPDRRPDVGEEGREPATPEPPFGDERGEAEARDGDDGDEDPRTLSPIDSNEKGPS